MKNVTRVPTRETFHMFRMSEIRVSDTREFLVPETRVYLLFYLFFDFVGCSGEFVFSKATKNTRSLVIYMAVAGILQQFITQLFVYGWILKFHAFGYLDIICCILVSENIKLIIHATYELVNKMRKAT